MRKGAYRLVTASAGGKGVARPGVDGENAAPGEFLVLRTAAQGNDDSAGDCRAGFSYGADLDYGNRGNRQFLRRMLP